MSEIEARTDWTGKRGRRGALLMASPIRKMEEAFLGCSSRKLLRHALSSLREDAMVLDAGCGSGYLGLPIAAKLSSGKVICVDLSDEMLAALERRARARALDDRVLVLKAPVDSTGLAGGSVDLVVSNNLLHELRDPAAAVAEWRRVLKPGGRMVLSDFRSTRLVRLIMSHEHGEEASNPLDVESLSSLLEQAGLGKVEVTSCRHKLLAAAEKPART